MARTVVYQRRSQMSCLMKFRGYLALPHCNDGTAVTLHGYVSQNYFAPTMLENTPMV